jgi:hypothetical protein
MQKQIKKQKPVYATVHASGGKDFEIMFNNEKDAKAFKVALSKIKKPMLAHMIIEAFKHNGTPQFLF